jgi:hypothetical protein
MCHGIAYSDLLHPRLARHEISTRIVLHFGIHVEEVAAERNPEESAASLALHFPSHQHLHGGAVQPLPGRLSYPRPRLSEVGRPLRNVVAREDDQLERLRPTVGLLLGPVLYPHQGSRQPVGTDHLRGQLLRGVGDGLGSPEQMTTGASCTSSGR